MNTVDCATPPSLTAVRKQLGEALKPLRIELFSPAWLHGDPRPKPGSRVEVFGYRFTATRLNAGRGQTGYVWYPNYDGTAIDPELIEAWPRNVYGNISGNLDACAAQLHSRMRKLLASPSFRSIEEEVNKEVREIVR